MKPLTFNFLDAIRRGILRIFPKSDQIFSQIFVRISSVAIRSINTSSKARYSSALLLGLFFLILVGCSTSRHTTTQLVHDVRTDTLFISNVHYDSIYINRTSDIDRTSDTLTITKTMTEYRYKLLRDTIYKVQRDSIPYQVTITEIKEVTRPLTWFDHLTRFCFVLVFGFLFVSFVSFVFKLKSKIRV